jgi:hypothetical protein
MPRHLKMSLGIGILQPNQIAQQGFFIKLLFYHTLEICKTLKNFRFIRQKIDPCEFAIIIYETDIVNMPANKGRSQSPNIRKHKFKRT